MSNQTKNAQDTVKENNHSTQSTNNNNVVENPVADSYNDSIVVHSDQFHCDEVMATAIIQFIYNNEKKVVRTRDQKEIEKYAAGERNYIVDVGKIYNPALGRFDHHQQSFVMSFDGRTESDGECDIPMSSCGMVYKHLGQKLLNKVYPFLEEDTVEKLHKNFYYRFIQQIDANDNGIPFIHKDVTEHVDFKDKSITTVHFRFLL